MSARKKSVSPRRSPRIELSEEKLQQFAAVLEFWRRRGFDLARHRKWSVKWKARLAFHVLECSEFTEALRGKRSRQAMLEEAGDMLVTALTMIPEDVPLVNIVKRNFRKIAKLMTAPPYEHEDRGD